MSYTIVIAIGSASGHCLCKASNPANICSFDYIVASLTVCKFDVDALDLTLTSPVDLSGKVEATPPTSSMYAHGYFSCMCL